MEQDMLFAKYYIETEGDLRAVGEELAEIETTGKRPYGAETDDLFESCRGRLDTVEEINKGEGFITLALPMKNFNMEESAFSSLWLYMVGGATHALTSYKKSRLVDFWFDEKYNKYFTGPKWGIGGFKKYLGDRKSVV